MESGDSTIRTPDGLTLYYQWQRRPDPCGVILVVHGIGEHIGRYLDLEEWFTEQGFSCYGYDQRGHGRSGGPRTHVNDFSDYVADLQQITGIVQDREPGKPIFIYAHSMGTLVALLTVLHEPHHYRGLVIASPAITIGTGTPGWLLKIGSLLGKVLPGVHVSSQIEPANLSHDPAIVTAFEHDALVEGNVTLGWLGSILAAQQQVLRLAHAISIPVLALHSRADPIAAVNGTRELVQRMPQDKVTYHEYAEAYHELHNETAALRDTVLHDIRNWLEQQLAT